MRSLRRSSPLVVVALGALVAGATLSATGGADESGGADGGASSPMGGATVTVATSRFAPDPLEVEAGTTITFANEDAVGHTVTAGTPEEPTPELFDGRLPAPGATFELTLDAPGTYEYFCTLHPGPGTTGTIVVSRNDVQAAAHAAALASGDAEHPEEHDEGETHHG
jgi:plastocyanin